MELVIGWLILLGIAWINGYTVCELRHDAAERKAMPYVYRREGVTIRSNDEAMVLRFEKKANDSSADDVAGRIHEARKDMP